MVDVLATAYFNVGDAMREEMTARRDSAGRPSGEGKLSLTTTVNVNLKTEVFNRADICYQQWAWRPLCNTVDPRGIVCEDCTWETARGEESKFLYINGKVKYGGKGRYHIHLPLQSCLCT